MVLSSGGGKFSSMSAAAYIPAMTNLHHLPLLSFPLFLNTIYSIHGMSLYQQNPAQAKNWPYSTLTLDLEWRPWAMKRSIDPDSCDYGTNSIEMNQHSPVSRLSA